MGTWEQRDRMSTDTPNVFVQAKLNWKKGQSQVIMKITGALAEPLMKKAPPHTPRICGARRWEESNVP